MSVSKVSNRWLNRVYKCIAILLVIFAVMISGLRLFLPYAHNYRHDLQDYINQTYGSDVIIGTLNMSWQSSGPILVASNVSLLQSESTEIFIRGFDIQIDFWRSLKQRQLVTKDFSLVGVKVLFDQNDLANNSSGDSSILDNISELFLQQISKFSISNSQIIVRGTGGERTFLIDELYWLNEGDTHKAKGSVVLDGVTSNNIQLVMEVNGKTLDEMTGQLYLQANQLNIAPWLDRVFEIDIKDSESSINFDAWLSIENGKSKKIQIKLGENAIAWSDESINKKLNLAPGHIVIEGLNGSEGLTVYSSELTVSSDDQTWQPMSFELITSDNNISGYLTSLDVAGLTDLLPLALTDDQGLSLVTDINPSGSFEDIYFSINDENVDVIASFSRINSAYSNGIPGLTDINGEVVLSNRQLQVQLEGNAGHLDFGHHFSAPLVYDHIQAIVDVYIEENDWIVNVPNMTYSSADISLNGSVGIFGGNDKSTEMSLLADIQNVNVADAPKFYPVSVMGKQLVSYLNRSLVKGQLEQAAVIMNGPLANFPFEDGSGLFVVDAELKDATFKFDEQWPAITHFDANLNFTNNSMLITGREGSLTGIDVKGVTAKINDLANEQLLEVDAQFTDTAPKLVTNLMLASPLDESVGNVLEQLVISNNIAAKFSLALPINDVNSTVAKGDIYLANNEVDLTPLAMHFDKVTGKVSFENENVVAQGLSLAWRNMPLQVSVNTKQLPIQFQTKITLAANWADTGWHAQLPREMTKYGEGELNWTGQLVLNHYNDGDFVYDLAIDSDLKGTEFTLPVPYQKAATDEMPARIKVTGDLDQSTIDAQVGDQLTFYGKLSHEQIHFTQSHLILGKEPMFLPMSGFHVTSALALAHYEQWQPFIVDLLTSIDKASASSAEEQLAILPAPERIRGTISKVEFLGESLNDVSFNIADQQSWWLLSLSSLEARADVKFFPDFQQQGLAVEADYIRLAPEKLLFGDDVDKELSSAQSKTSKPFDIRVNDELFSDIPPLTVSCGECSYGNLLFGQVDFKLSRPSEDLIKINNFVAKRKNNKLQFDGQWQHMGDISQTRLTGELASKDVERELERLGFPSTVADSGLEANFDLNWLGGPQDFQVQNFNGDISAKLDEGVLKEVPDQARAFSILSLQSLVRKLKFDFRDIFADGMFYSEIKGDYHIQDGVIYTKNTFMKGAAGDLSLKGNTNLNTDMLDYSMSYAPNVTSSLPAIAWIATLNPVTFLAGVAIDGVITSQVPVEYKFALTGSLSEPDFRQIDKKTKNISVGRDTPPQIVENLPDKPIEPKIKGVLNPETGLIEPIDDNQLENLRW